MSTPNIEPRIVATDPNTGQPADTAILEEAGIAFDPTNMTLDLTKEEKRRTTSLMLAIQAYEKLIIKDAEMYNAIAKDRDRNDGPKIQPATINAMVSAAIDFDDFISGKIHAAMNEIKKQVEPEQPKKGKKEASK